MSTKMAKKGYGDFYERIRHLVESETEVEFQEKLEAFYEDQGISVPTGKKMDRLINAAYKHDVIKEEKPKGLIERVLNKFKKWFRF